jgi:phage baseplate assembly protein W
MTSYKGISFPFRFNSKGGVTSNELSPIDFSRIFESIRQIIFTRKRERVMLADKGTDAETALFEPSDDLTEMGILRHEIMKAIDEQEDRVSVNDVYVSEITIGDEVKLLVEVDAHIIKFMQDEKFQIVI